jgi:putative chitinase
MTFDRPTVWRNLPRVGLRKTVQLSLDTLLDLIETDLDWTMLRQVAYFLATVQWETAGTMKPIRERRASQRQGRLRQLQDRYWLTGFYGRGYIQLTWEKNYRKAERLTGRPFVADPDLLLSPPDSYLVASRGMREGWFTGKGLNRYIEEGRPPDYLNARRVVNGLDAHEDIAALASNWELVLRSALLGVDPV